MKKKEVRISHKQQEQDLKLENKSRLFASSRSFQGL